MKRDIRIKAPDPFLGPTPDCLEKLLDTAYKMSYPTYMPDDASYIEYLFKQTAKRLPHSPFRVAMNALLVFNGRMEMMGHNSHKTHPLAARFSKHPEAIHIHAELDAILRASKYLNEGDWQKCTLYIMRAKYRDERKKVVIQGLAKPCEGCTKLIAYYGINRVVYSLDNAGYCIVE